MNFIDNKKVGGMFENNLQEVNRAISPLPQSNCFEETRSSSTSTISEMTPNTTGYNRTMGATITHLPTQNKAINKTGVNEKGESTKESKEEIEEEMFKFEAN